MASGWGLGRGKVWAAEANAFACTGSRFRGAKPDVTPSEDVTAGVIMMGTGDAPPPPRRPDLTANASPATAPTSPNKTHVRLPVIICE